jgi:hypothetical protein
MQTDYREEGKVKFTVPHMIKEIIEQLPTVLNGGPSNMPAANHLFQVNQKATKLDQESADLFHRLTAQLLYLSKRARPD